MKQAIGIFMAVIMMPAFTTQAWIGGPFSANTYNPSGDDGIYEAVATTSNGVGLYRWAVQNNSISASGGFTPGTPPAAGTTISSNVQFNGSLVGAASQNVWYYKGITYTGPCFGVVNTPAKIVSCVGNAVTQQPAAAGPFTGNTSGFNGLFFAGAPNVAGNVSTANSNFIGKITSKAPVVRFSGRGTISFLGNIQTLDTDTITITYPPTVLPNGVTIQRTQLTVNSAGDPSGGETQAFAQRGHRKRFLVFGTKVSHVVLP